jgi:DNA-binding MarR family transcriptional regulator
MTSPLSSCGSNTSTRPAAVADSAAEQFRRASEVQHELLAERMQGITDDEIATTIRVLQRTIENVGGDAWHW